jgi:hypothetical protein
MNARALADVAVIERALVADKTCARVMARGLRPSNGDLVGVRLNLNLLKTQKVAVQTIHKGNQSGGHRKGKGFYNGSPIWYQAVVVLKDVYFNVHQPGRHKIASGEVSKFPMASCDGVLCDVGEVSLDGLEVRFDPKLVHLFTDMQNRAIRWAEEATVYGHRAFVRGLIEYYDEATAPAKAGDAPSAVVFAAAPNFDAADDAPDDVVLGARLPTPTKRTPGQPQLF